MKKNAEVFILLGQSNAVGHDLPMQEKDVITDPMAYVYGLSRADNQNLYPEKLTFSGYQSAGMNLAEEQDNTYSLANCLAAQWEKEARKNPDMPDLYIIQIAIGAQGIGPGFMWNPDYPQQLIPGKLGVVRISLFPFTQRILSLLKPTFAQMGVDYHIMGVHWRGGEDDTAVQTPKSLIPNLKPLYERLFEMLRSSLGELPKTVLYQMRYGEKTYERPGTDNLRDSASVNNRLFAEFAEKYPQISLFDPFSLSLYRPEDPQTWGIFSPEDGVHYSAAANCEIAEKILAEYLADTSKK